MTQLANQIAVVTGAGRGIGQAISLKLAGAGADVVCVDLKTEFCDETVQRVQALGRKAWSFAANVADAASIEAVAKQILAAAGRVDILVNNAGITRDALLMRMTDEQWDAVIQTNLTGVFLATQAAIKPMVKARWGRVISIASVVGLTGNVGQANYASAKAGVIAMTKTLARELASRNITANALAPGFIETPMTQGLPDEVKSAFLASIPLRRAGKPVDVAHAALFLASEEASYITGQVLNVDGGLVM